MEAKALDRYPCGVKKKAGGNNRYVKVLSMSFLQTVHVRSFLFDCESPFVRSRGMTVLRVGVLFGGQKGI